MRIPKIIHYCWFGPNKPTELVNKCIDSWLKYAPDYKIILWNEDNFDINKFYFVKHAYENKKYAFVTDFVRLYVLKEYGGIYLDSDVELLKGIDGFLVHNAFSGFEDNKTVPTGIMGSEKKGKWVSELIEYYLKYEHGDIEFIPNTKIITTHASKNGLIANNKSQYLDVCQVFFYSSDYFCPKSHYTGKIELTKNTYSIHHFSGSWLTRAQKIKRFLSKIIINIFGVTFYNWLRGFR